ncbi:type II secretion system F family protein [Saccharopolyspora rosea]|uniref:type II secretion system F family protein n=1 Tax=Saccharopolyspora rosea TaxID=524884 RepID=UPI0021DAA11F|nr:type II secretion system F family protein [Saccharopolyspora rosea]
MVALVLAAFAVALFPLNGARTRLRTVRPTAPKRLPSKSTVVGAASAVFLVGGVVVAGPVFGVGLAGCVVAAVLLESRRRRRRQELVDPLVLAAGWDLLAAGMRAGLPVPVVVHAVAEEFSGAARRALREVAEHLALGADALAAWEPALRCPDTLELARAARRTARTGSGLAEIAAELAGEVRASAADDAQTRAQRASVWITAPLATCFLPAFVCLGVLPVLVGMLHRLPIQL